MSRKYPTLTRTYTKRCISHWHLLLLPPIFLPPVSPLPLLLPRDIPFFLNALPFLSRSYAFLAFALLAMNFPVYTLVVALAACGSGLVDLAFSPTRSMSSSDWLVAFKFCLCLFEIVCPRPSFSFSY